MARLTIYRDDYMNSTVVSNFFIDEFMKDANDAQLKVYLYLIRMLNAQQATSVSDIADKFNHTEKDIVRALNYWEEKQLLTLDYDTQRNLVGIHLRDLNRSGTEQTAEVSPVLSMNTTASCVPVHSFIPTQDAPQSAPIYGFHPVSEAGNSNGYETDINSIAMEHSGKNRNAKNVEEAFHTFTKPSFSIDQLREFKNREETAQLLFITESYIGRPLTPNEMKSILFIKDVLDFSDDLVDYLIQYCVDRGKKDFKYIEKVAIAWAEEGITTPKEAELSSSKYNKNIYSIMNMLGKTNSPTPKEVEYITRWTSEYGFSNDIILEACERTVLATDKHRFEYAEGILSNWKRQNVHHKADIHKIDDLYQMKRRGAANKSASANTNKFNQFAQNNYDFDALERELLSN